MWFAGPGVAKAREVFSGATKKSGVVMTPLTAFGAGAVAFMMLFYALEGQSSLYTLGFSLTCVGASVYGWLAGTWPFGVVEGIWAVVAFRKFLHRNHRPPR